MSVTRSRSFRPGLVQQFSKGCIDHHIALILTKLDQMIAQELDPTPALQQRTDPLVGISVIGLWRVVKATLEASNFDPPFQCWSMPAADFFGRGVNEMSVGFRPASPDGRMMPDVLTQPQCVLVDSFQMAEVVFHLRDSDFVFLLLLLLLLGGR